jgi:hypothetical protein
VRVRANLGARWGNNLPYGYNMFGIAELTKIALERCATARCAVQTMGTLAEEYGFYSEDSGDPSAPLYFLSAESAAVADKREVWLFHVLTGPNNSSAIWAAIRVPDDHGDNPLFCLFLDSPRSRTRSTPWRTTNIKTQTTNCTFIYHSLSALVSMTIGGTDIHSSL